MADRYLGGTTLAKRTVNINPDGSTTYGPTTYYAASPNTFGNAEPGAPVIPSYQAASSSLLNQNMIATGTSPVILYAQGQHLSDPTALPTTVAAPTPPQSLGSAIVGGAGSSNVPASAQSPTSTASAGSQQTAATPNVLSDLSSIIAGLQTGQNAANSGTGAGIGQNSTSLPSPSAADVAALQPTVAGTSKSGPSLVLIIGILVLLGGGAYYYFQHKKGA
jgi:hypothetical protein